MRRLPAEHLRLKEAGQREIEQAAGFRHAGAVVDERQQGHVAETGHQLGKNLVRDRRQDGDLRFALYQVRPGIEAVLAAFASHHEAGSATPSRRRVSDSGVGRIANLTFAGNQQLGARKRFVAHHAEAHQGVARVLNGHAEQRFGRPQQTHLPVAQLGIDQVGRHLADDHPAGDARQRRQKHDGHDGDEQVGGDQPVAQPPDRPAHEAAGQLERSGNAHQERHDSGRPGEGPQTGQIERQEKRQQNQKGALDAATPPPPLRNTFRHNCSATKNRWPR